MFMRVDEVAEELGVSIPYAYKLIRTMNEELRKTGLRQIDRVNDPAYLPSLSMNELYEKVYPGKPPVVEGLLYPGVYLFVGAPKVGKSFLMAQLAYHVSKGLPCGGTKSLRAVLYLALEDDYPRLQGGCTGCSGRTAPQTSTFPFLPNS